MTDAELEARVLEIGAEKARLTNGFTLEPPELVTFAEPFDPAPDQWSIDAVFSSPGTLVFIQASVYRHEAENPGWKRDFLREALSQESPPDWALRYVRDRPLDALLPL